MTTSIRLQICHAPEARNNDVTRMEAGSPVMSCCGARNSSLAKARRISTAATPFCLLFLPQAALANVPTSIRLQNVLIIPGLTVKIKEKHCVTRSGGHPPITGWWRRFLLPAVGRTEGPDAGCCHWCRPPPEWNRGWRAD